MDTGTSSPTSLLHDLNTLNMLNGSSPVCVPHKALSGLGTSDPKDFNVPPLCRCKQMRIWITYFSFRCHFSDISYMPVYVLSYVWSSSKLWEFSWASILEQWVFLLETYSSHTCWPTWSCCIQDALNTHPHLKCSLPSAAARPQMVTMATLEYQWPWPIYRSTMPQPTGMAQNSTTLCVMVTVIIQQH